MYIHQLYIQLYNDKENLIVCCMLVNTFADETIACIAVVACAGVAAMCVSAGGIWVTVITSGTFIHVCGNQGKELHLHC